MHVLTIEDNGKGVFVAFVSYSIYFLAYINSSASKDNNRAVYIRENGHFSVTENIE